MIKMEQDTYTDLMDTFKELENEMAENRIVSRKLRIIRMLLNEYTKQMVGSVQSLADKKGRGLFK